MFFNLFLDPAVVEDADSRGEDGLGRLIDFLRAHIRDCLFTETDSWRVGEEIRLAIENISLPDERKDIEILITTWASRAPIVLINGDDRESSLIDLAKDQAENYDIDLVLSPSFKTIMNGGIWEGSSLSQLHNSQFAKRCEEYSPDIQINEGSISATEIWTRHYAKLIRFAEKISIVDYSLGQHCGLSQRVCLRKWFLWINTCVENPETLRIVVYTYSDRKEQLDEVLNQLRSTIRLQITIYYYPSYSESLPHERYFASDSRWIDFGRGIDMFDAQEMCRDVALKHAKKPHLPPTSSAERTSIN